MTFATQVGGLMGELVFDYLLHEGWLDSAAAVARDVLADAVQVWLDVLTR